MLSKALPLERKADIIITETRGPNEQSPEYPNESSSAFLPPRIEATPIPSARTKGTDTAPVVAPPESKTIE